VVRPLHVFYLYLQRATETIMKVACSIPHDSYVQGCHHIHEANWSGQNAPHFNQSAFLRLLPIQWAWAVRRVDSKLAVSWLNGIACNFLNPILHPRCWTKADPHAYPLSTTCTYFCHCTFCDGDAHYFWLWSQVSIKVAKIKRNRQYVYIHCTWHYM